MAGSTPSPALLWRMTRPAFLLLTVVACLLGTATAAACGCGLDWWLAAAATLLAVLAHAAGNLLNDLHDAKSGADAANHQGIYPFTGGSRLIQRGLVTEGQTAALAHTLLLVLVPAGLLLAVKTAGGVLLPAGRSSRTYVHKRPVLVLPWPGASTAIGVSSAWTLLAAMMCCRNRLTNGCKSRLASPTQSAKVERSRDTPSRA